MDDIATKSAKLEAIAARIEACQECRLYQSATNAVPGYGDVNADILFIGEAPGFHEDQQGVPFVGRSGKYLDYLLNLIDMKREDVFITNTVKHRPPDNRDPLADEMAACKGFLDEQYAVIDPRVIVTLGRFSMEYCLGKNYKITKIHGQPIYRDDRAFYPMFHPAAALRNAPLRWDMEADIKRLPEVIAEVNKRRAAGGFDPAPQASIPDPTDAPGDDDNPPDEPEQLSLF